MVPAAMESEADIQVRRAVFRTTISSRASLLAASELALRRLDAPVETTAAADRTATRAYEEGRSDASGWKGVLLEGLKLARDNDIWVPVIGREYPEDLRGGSPKLVKQVKDRFESACKRSGRKERFWSKKAPRHFPQSKWGAASDRPEDD